MRLLHARLHHGVGRPTAQKSQAHRSGNYRSARQQYLPLHRLCEDHRGGAIRSYAQCAGSVAVNEIVPAHNIGGYVPMIDGPEKVSGRAKYTADIIPVSYTHLRAHETVLD